ncbi:MAG: MFS transporter [Chloroflexota bacterium]
MHTSPERKPSTLSALRSPNFRLYFVGQLVSNSGTWMQNIAQSYLVFKITGSELWLGIVACAAGLPIVLMSPIGGVIIERVPRQTILKFTQTIQMILAFILAILTFSNLIQVWHIVVLAVMLGVTNSLDIPARQTIVVEMVGKEDLYSGIALNSIMNSLGRILGPTAAGIALVQFGAGWCFLLNGLSFVAVLISLFLMKVPYAIKYAGNSSPIRQLREGLSFARHDPLIPPLLLLAAVAGLLVLPILRLLPAVADILLNSPEAGYAALSVGEGGGALIAGVLVGFLSQRFGHGKLIAAAVIVNALANGFLAWQTNIPPAVLITAFFGGSMIMLFVCLNTVIQTIVPDNFRGRVLSLYSLAMIGTSPFGALALGAFADRFGIQAALIVNGLLIALLSGAILLRWPQVLHFHSQTETVTIPEEVLPAIGD